MRPAWRTNSFQDEMLPAAAFCSPLRGVGAFYELRFLFPRQLFYLRLAHPRGAGIQLRFEIHQLHRPMGPRVASAVAGAMLAIAAHQVVGPSGIEGSVRAAENVAVGRSFFCRQEPFHGEERSDDADEQQLHDGCHKVTHQ